VALIYNQIAVLADEVVDHMFMTQALSHRHVDLPGRLMLAAANLPNLLRCQAQELAQCFNPLVEQLLAMNDHQGVDPALRDQVSGDHCFAKSRRS